MKDKPEPPASDGPEASLFDEPDIRTVSLVIIALGVTIFLLHHMHSLLAPVAFGLLLFYALDPAVDSLERVRVPRWIAAAVVLGLTMGTILGGLYALQDEAMTVVNQLPSGARRIAALIERRPQQVPGPLDKVEQAAKELAKTDTTKPPPGVVRDSYGQDRWARSARSIN